MLSKKRGRKKFIIISILIIFVAITTFMLWPSNISRNDAQEIALAYIGGSYANPASRDFARFQRVWSVEVFYGGLVHEVYINMRTGDIVRVEVDRWD